MKSIDSTDKAAVTSDDLGYITCEGVKDRTILSRRLLFDVLETQRTTEARQGRPVENQAQFYIVTAMICLRNASAMQINNLEAFNFCLTSLAANTVTGPSTDNFAVFN